MPDHTRDEFTAAERHSALEFCGVGGTDESNPGVTTGKGVGTRSDDGTGANDRTGDTRRGQRTYGDARRGPADVRATLDGEA